MKKVRQSFSLFHDFYYNTYGRFNSNIKLHWQIRVKAEPAAGKDIQMANGKGIFKNFYSSFRTLPVNVTAPELHDSTTAYGVVTDEFFNFGQRMAAQNRNANAKEDYLNNCRWPSSLKHTYCYYWAGAKTDGIKEALLVFYNYECGKHYVRVTTGELTQAQLEELEAVIKAWHFNGKLIIHKLDFPIEIEAC